LDIVQEELINNNNLFTFGDSNTHLDDEDNIDG